jgi:formylglycine-generating enzyme required for sulfatase activity
VVETVTGREPLEGDDFLQLGVAAANPERRPTPRALGAPVTDEVEGVFAKALAVKPADRWQTAGDFWNALRLALQMDPMRGMTNPMLRSGTTSRPPIATAPTVAAASDRGAISGTSMAREAMTGPSARAAATTGRRPGAGKMGLFVGLGVGAVLAIGAATFALGRGHGAPAAATPTSGSAAVAAPPASVAARAAPASAPAGCPKDMIAIPGGSFYMGSDEGIPLERPAHQVELSPYCIDQFEVTVEKYKACSDAGRCKRASTTNQWESITDKDRKAFDPLCNVRDPEGHASHPINCVDWEMADKFCREDGKRLPTEAEWEFAARGPDGRKYPWGDDDPSAGYLNACGRECMAWGAKNGVEEKAMYDADDGYANTAPVGSFPKGASRYGVQDVVGNVWEWVADYYGPYSKEEQKAPTGPATGDEKVIRGGAWNGSYASWVRPTFRYKDAPTKRSYGIGFRCAK